MTPREALEKKLSLYTGTQESLDEFVEAAINALGPNWTETIYQTLSNLSPDQQERLDHAFKYYAALTAWAEAQSYLAQETLTNKSEIQERIPILEHWLAFFEGQGSELITELQRRLDETAEPIQKVEIRQQEKTERISERPSVLEEEAATNTEPSTDTTSEKAPEPETTTTVVPEDITIREIPKEPTHEEAFEIKRIKKQISLTQDLQAWIAARCIHLDKKNVYEYPFFGLMLDMMEETKKEIIAVFENPDLDEALKEPDNPTAVYLKDIKTALEGDLAIAYQYLESQPSDLVKQGLDALTIRKTLGELDTSNTKEVLGPAPDGFEPLMDPYETIDEGALRAKYDQIETKVLSPKDVASNEAVETTQKNTSQTPQNDVKRKLSFSFGAKKG